LIDVAALLAEVAPDAPVGPDLGYDPEFLALEHAARGRPEQQFGETTVGAEEPSWGDIQERALGLLSRTKDVRVACLLTRALTCLHDFAGLAAGLDLIYGLLDRYWEHVHPGLDAEDNLDPTMRLNALMALSDPDTLLRDVRNLYLVHPGRHGTVSVRAVLIALGKWSAGGGDVAMSRTEIDSVLRAAAAGGGVPITELRISVQTLNALRVLLVEKVGVDRVPELRPLQEMLAAVTQVCDTALGVAEVQASAHGTNLESAGAAVQQFTGEIRGRDDAVRMLQQVVEFIERTEPANPAPLFIRRAQRLMVKSFVEIIQDLVPESLGQIQKMAGLEGE